MFILRACKHVYDMEIEANGKSQSIVSRCWEHQLKQFSQRNISRLKDG